MRKLTIFAALFTFVLFTSWSVALGSWVSFNGGGNPAPPQIEVLGSDGTQTTVHITVPGMVVEDKEVDGQIYQVLRIPDDNATMLDVGKPELPAIRKLVGIPPTCNVSVAVVNQSYTELDGYLVYPFQEPLMEGEEPGPFVIDTALYETDSFYPQEIAEVGTPAVWRDVRVTRLSLYPVIFNPVTGILRVYDEITVQLNYSGTDGVNPLVNPPPMVSPSFNKLYMSSLINYDYLNLNVSDLPLGYLIISPVKYLLPVNSLADWKEKKGIPTFIEEAPEGCDNDWVKNTISQYYEELSIEYVLLVGTEEDIPMYSYYPRTHSWLGDFWYTLLANNDDYPDVAIGRFSVYSSTDVTTNVNKVFAYERYPDPNWDVTNALFVCWGDVEYPFPHYCQCKRSIASNTMTGTGFTIQTAYGEEEGVTNQTVIDAFQSPGGLGIVNYRGHGWAIPGHPPLGWYKWNLLNECFTPDNANALVNSNHFPVVYNVCCEVGSIQHDSLVLAEAFCNNPNGGGSGALGATEGIKTYPNSDFDRKLFEAPFDSAIFELGNIINYAKIYVQNEHGWYGFTRCPGISLAW